MSIICSNKISRDIPEEKGAILVETLIMTPVILMFYLFCADFLAYTKSQTFVAQVTREVAIYFATSPGEPYPGDHEDLVFDENFYDAAQMCEDDAGFDQATYCHHMAAQVRAFRAIKADASTFNLENLRILTSYDNVQDTVQVQIRVDKKILFFSDVSTIESTAALRKVNI